MKMKVFVIFGLMAILVNCEQIVDKKDNETNLTQSTEDKTVQKRGIYHREPFLAPQAAFWPKTYAAHYGYNLRALGVSGFAPTLIKHKPLSYVLRPGGASVQSYSASFPRYHAKHVYAVPQFAAQPALEAAPVHPHFVQTNFVAPPAAPVVPAIAAAPPHQHFVPTSFVASQPTTFNQIDCTAPHQHFVTNSFVPPPVAPAPVFNPQPAPVPAPVFNPAPSLPEFPAIAFETQFPPIPQPPPVPQPPQIPTIPSPSTVGFVFPLSFQPPRPQAPPTFGNNPVGVEFPQFIPVSNNPPTDAGSAVASPQIPAPQPTAPTTDNQQPEFPTFQHPPLQTETPWRPLYAPPSDNQRPTITLQPPTSGPSNEYLPPAGPQSLQEINHSSQKYSNYNDGISDNEIAHIFQQSKFVPHHAHHISRFHH